MGVHGRLRVGVPRALAGTPGGWGHGNMWRHVLGRLSQMAQVVVRDPGPGGPRGRVSAWLLDGHHALPRTRAPRVAEIHEAGWQEPELRATLGAGFVAAMDSAVRATVEQADAIICLAEHGKAQICRAYGADPERVHAVHLGVDAALFRPGVGGGAQLVTLAGGRPGVPYVLYVGLLHPRKNLGGLRAAMSQLASDGLPHQLVVVGALARDREDAVEIAASLTAPLPGHPGRVTHLQGLTDGQLAALMSGASALCLPSLMEGFGLPALEGMAAGTPVVVSDRGSLPEIVGDAGLVVEPTVSAIASGLREVLEDEVRAAALSSAGRARALGFTWDRTAQGWLRVLEDTVASARGRQR